MSNKKQTIELIWEGDLYRVLRNTSTNVVLVETKTHDLLGKPQWTYINPDEHPLAQKSAITTALTDIHKQLAEAKRQIGNLEARLNVRE